MRMSAWTSCGNASQHRSTVVLPTRGTALAPGQVTSNHDEVTGPVGLVLTGPLNWGTELV